MCMRQCPDKPVWHADAASVPAHGYGQVKSLPAWSSIAAVQLSAYMHMINGE